MAIDCSPEVLSDASSIYQGIPDGRKWDALLWIFGQLAGVTYTAQQLLEESRCYQCIPPGRKLDSLIFVACQITGGSGGAVCIVGGTADPNVAPVAIPCEFSGYVQTPGPNYGFWLGDQVSGTWSNVIQQGP